MGATLAADARMRAAEFARALAAYRARDFRTALQIARGVSLANDPVARRFAERVAALDATALPEDWAAVTALDAK
jgi:hypothetical protein